MPRPLARPGFLTGAIALVIAAVAGQNALHEALAAAAGTILEAAPFVLLAEWAGSRAVTSRLAGLAGCGCTTGDGAGALALPAAALAWLAFGPAIAGLRLAAGAAARFRFLRGRPARTHAHGPPAASGPSAALDVPAELGAVAAAAFCGALLAGGIRAIALPPAAALLAGLVLGTLAPCATAGVALASGFAHGSPAVAAGILATAGIVALPRARGAPSPTPRAIPWTSALLAAALATAASGAAPGFVNPRLAIALTIGAALAIAGALRRRSRVSWSAALPLALFGAFAAGSPVPTLDLAVTQVRDAAPGDRLAFLGAVHQSAAATTLVRYAIACCRLDAAPIAVRLARRLDVPESTWIAARGVLELRGGALVLVATDARAVAPPRDPFVYW